MKRRSKTTSTRPQSRLDGTDGTDGTGIYDDSILRSLRRIMRAVDLHSRQLARQHNLTGPQLVCLRRLSTQDGITHGELAEAVSLSQATVTGIVDRLEMQGLVRRERSTEDRRAVRILLTDNGRKIIRSAPSGLQERFATRLRGLSKNEQAAIDRALRQIVIMMEADSLDAAPILDASSVLDAPPLVTTEKQ
ncbi:MAG: MarR family transcriptional regulator [Proteobacteria bacterium]|jgi:DNA-binding MarR family transcriptional regulator|nr:MarR family transcriptional regulator [Pseudomonadota bacterium]